MAALQEYQFNPLFREALQPLREHELVELENNIVKNGLRDNPRLWRGVVWDGHNRIGILTKHGIPFVFEDDTDRFASEDEVLAEIYANQLARRNITPAQETELLGELYNVRKRIEAHRFTDEDRAKAVAARYGDDAILDVIGEPDPKPEPKRTADVIAEETGKSARTVKRAGQVAEALKTLPEEDQEKFRAGEMSQADVLKKAAPKKEKAEKVSAFAPGKNADTVLIESKVKRMSLATQRYERALNEILVTGEGDPKRLPQIVVDLSTSLADQVKTNLVRLDELSDVFICEACDAKNGDNCKEANCYAGYTDEDTHIYQLRKIKEDETWKPTKLAENGVTPATPDEPKPEPKKKGAKKATKKPESSDTEASSKSKNESEPKPEPPQPETETPQPEPEAAPEPQDSTPVSETQTTEAAGDTELSPSMEEALERHPEPPEEEATEVAGPRDDESDEGERAQAGGIEETESDIVEAFESISSEIENETAAPATPEPEEDEEAADEDPDDILSFVDDVLNGKSSSD